MTTYIYGLYCPIDENIRYVGKSDDPVNRLTSHVSAARGKYYEHHTCRWLRKILKAGFYPRLVFLQQIEDGECWKTAERNWIIKARSLGWRITNTGAGGEGVEYLNPEDEARFCAAVKAGVNTPGELARRGEEMRARHKDPEWKAKIAACMADPEMIKRRGSSIKEARNTPESKAKTSAQSKAMHADPEWKAKRAASIKAAKNTPEAKARTSAQMLERWATKKAAEIVIPPVGAAEIKKAEAKARKSAYAKVRRAAKKAAILAATTATPYTESS